MRKYVLSMLVLLLCLVMLPKLSFAAESSIQLYMNGANLNPEVSPRKIGGTSMVPIRIISESLGAKVSWNQNLQMVTIEKGNTNIQLTINDKNATVNSSSISLEAAPVLIAGNTLLPVRFVAENLGISVNWDDAAQSVYLLDSPEIPNNNNTQPAPVVLPVDSASEVQSMQVMNDQLVIQANSPLKPNIFPLSNPDRLVIDIPQTKFGQGIVVPGPGQMGGIWTSLPFVSQIRYAVNDLQTATLRLVMEFKGNTKYDIIENGSTNKIAIKVQPVQQPQHRYKVVIDAGHGDHDSGAVSINGRYEKDFNLAMAKKVIALLQQEPMIEVLATRTNDVFVPLNDRVALANNNNADLFLSIHGNMWTPDTTGTQTYYYNDYSLEYANIMHRHVVQAAGLKDDHVRYSDFRVIHGTKMPAVLIECGYLSNAKEEPQMFDPAWQDRVAAAMVAGMKEYLKVN